MEEASEENTKPLVNETSGVETTFGEAEQMDCSQLSRENSQEHEGGGSTFLKSADSGISMVVTSTPVCKKDSYVPKESDESDYVHYNTDPTTSETESSEYLTGVVETQIFADSESESVERVGNEKDSPQSTECALTSKLACVLLKTIGYYCQLKELDEMRANNTMITSDAYKSLLHFFRRKVICLRTKIQNEMIKLEKKKTEEI